MHVLRWVLLVGCVGCVGLVAWNGRWEGHLTHGNHTWIEVLDRSPIWAPPPEPEYATFQSEFERLEDFPATGKPDLTIKRVLKVDWMFVDLLLYLWPVTIVVGLLYIAVSGKRRDLVLHLGLCSGIGLTAGAVGCVAIWLLFGGWGPPAPEFFGGLGLVGGTIWGVVSFRGDRAESGKDVPFGTPSPHHRASGSALGGSTKRSKFRPE